MEQIVEFVKQVLPWLLAGGGIGAYIGRFVEHKFAMHREERGRIFGAKKKAYGRLSDAMYDFDYHLELFVKVNNEDELAGFWQKWRDAEINIRKALAQARLYVAKNTHVARVMDELDSWTQFYPGLVTYSYLREHKMKKKDKEYLQKEIGKFDDITNRFIQEMQKDLGVK